MIGKLKICTGEKRLAKRICRPEEFFFVKRGVRFQHSFRRCRSGRAIVTRTSRWYISIHSCYLQTNSEDEEITWRGQLMWNENNGEKYCARQSAVKHEEVIRGTPLRLDKYGVIYNVIVGTSMFLKIRSDLLTPGQELISKSGQTALRRIHILGYVMRPNMRIRWPLPTMTFHTYRAQE